MPGAAERVRIWRRLRRQRRVRDALLLDLGALVYELHRQGRRAPELLQAKAGELSEIDDEVRGLEESLEDGQGPEPMPDGETDEWAAADTGEWPGGEEEAYEGEEEVYEGEEDVYDEPYEGEEDDEPHEGEEDDEPHEGEDEYLYEDDDRQGDVYDDDGEPAAPDDEEPRP